MQIKDIQGFHRLVEMLDASARLAEPARITAQAQAGLSELLNSDELMLPAQAAYAPPGQYARRLLYRSKTYGYVVIAMAWAPGVRSAIHDHGGAWGVEAVVSGRIEESRFALKEQSNGFSRLHRAGVIAASHGQCGTLVPQQDYHQVMNPSYAIRAVTLHVYSRDLTHCRLFEHHSEDWYTWKLGRLSYDAWKEGASVEYAGETPTPASSPFWEPQPSAA